jgi:hypothetical protein
MQEISLLMSGAHADIEAVFDYSPDAKLLAADRAVDEWAGADEHEEGANDEAVDTDAQHTQSPSSVGPIGSSPNQNRDHGGNIGISRASGVAGMIRGLGDADGREEIEADEEEYGSVGGSIPISKGVPIARIATEGILATSPSNLRARTSAIGQHLTFEPGKSVPSGTVPPPKRRTSAGERDRDQSPLERLYARDNNFDMTTRPAPGAGMATSVGGAGGDSVPSWMLELNATLRGIEMRQRKIETILDRLNDLANQGVDDDMSAMDD